jgi:hypothetical protein
VRRIALAVGALIIALATFRVLNPVSRRAAPAPALSFEANRGQTDPRVAFLTRGVQHTLFLTPSEAVLRLTAPDSAGTTNFVLRMSFEGANPRPRLAGLGELPGRANYFIGKDPAQWHANVPLYAQVQYSTLYPGIDLRCSGDQRHVTYQFSIHPGADPTRILLDWQGVDSLDIDAQGALVLHVGAGAALLRQPKPDIYQDLNGVRHEIAGGYARRAARQVGFQVPTYDRDRPVFITSVVPLSLVPQSSSQS